MKPHGSEDVALPTLKRLGRAGTRVVWSVLGLLSVVTIGSYLVVLVPTLPVWAWVWSVFATAFSFFLVPAVIGAATALLVWRRHRAMAAGAAVLVVLAVVAVAVPWAASARTASANGVSLSVVQQFSAGPRVTGPTDKEVYATVDGTALHADIWKPAGARTHAGKALVYVHGGGFTGGGLDQRPTLMQWYADRGFTVFDVEYRMAPQPLWREETRDVKCAVGWVAKNARSLGVDANRITIAGNSAGGNLAMLAAYTVGTGTFTPSCDVPEHTVEAVIASYTPMDTADTSTGVPSIVDSTNSNYFGGTPETAPEAYTATSPITYVRRGLPPTLILQGATDHLNPPEEATRMGDALRQARAPERTVLLPYADHLFDRFWGSWAGQLSYRITGQFLTKYTSSPGTGG